MISSLVKNMPPIEVNSMHLAKCYQILKIIFWVLGETAYSPVLFNLGSNASLTASPKEFQLPIARLKVQSKSRISHHTNKKYALDGIKTCHKEKPNMVRLEFVFLKQTADRRLLVVLQVHSKYSNHTIREFLQMCRRNYWL